MISVTENSGASIGRSFKSSRASVAVKERRCVELDYELFLNPSSSTVRLEYDRRFRRYRTCFIDIAGLAIDRYYRVPSAVRSLPMPPSSFHLPEEEVAELRENVAPGAEQAVSLSSLSRYLHSELYRRATRYPREINTVQEMVLRHRPGQVLTQYFANRVHRARFASSETFSESLPRRVFLAASAMEMAFAERISRLFEFEQPQLDSPESHPASKLAQELIEDLSSLGGDGVARDRSAIERWVGRMPIVPTPYWVPTPERHCAERQHEAVW